MGIFAQAAGNGMTEVTKIGITIDGAVTGGSGSEAAGIYVSDGSNVTGGLANTITIGSVNGTSGMAIRSIYGTTDVTNDGTITGIYNLSSGSFSGSAALPLSGGSIVNNGTINAGALLRADRLVNGGILDVNGDEETGTTMVAGDFVQTGGGMLKVNVDSLRRTADVLHVTGDVDMAGAVTPVAKALLPGTFRIMEMDGQFATPCTTARAPSWSTRTSTRWDTA